MLDNGKGNRNVENRENEHEIQYHSILMILMGPVCVSLVLNDSVL